MLLLILALYFDSILIGSAERCCHDEYAPNQQNGGAVRQKWHERRSWIWSTLWWHHFQQRTFLRSGLQVGKWLGLSYFSSFLCRLILVFKAYRGTLSFILRSLFETDKMGQNFIECFWKKKKTERNSEPSCSAFLSCLSLSILFSIMTLLTVFEKKRKKKQSIKSIRF